MDVLNNLLANIASWSSSIESADFYGLTLFDILVLLLVALGILRGFMRGLVEETLALSAWIFAIIMVRLLHELATDWLIQNVDISGGEALLAFLLLFVASLLIGWQIAGWVGKKIRASAIGYIDRGLGSGFGAIKGMLVATILFMIATLFNNMDFYDYYDSTAPVEIAVGEAVDSARTASADKDMSEVAEDIVKAEPPDWIASGRTYPALSAMGGAISSVLAEYHQLLRDHSAPAPESQLTLEQALDHALEQDDRTHSAIENAESGDANTAPAPDGQKTIDDVLDEL